MKIEQNKSGRYIVNGIPVKKKFGQLCRIKESGKVPHRLACEILEQYGSGYLGGYLGAVRWLLDLSSHISEDQIEESRI